MDDCALDEGRWFKLARVMKLNKFGAVLAFCFDFFMVSPKQQRKFAVGLGVLG